MQRLTMFSGCKNIIFWLLLAGLLFLFACAKAPEPIVPVVVELAPEEEPIVEERPVVPEVKPPALQEVTWPEVEGWQEDNPNLAFSAFLKSCTALRWRPQWQSVCRDAKAMEYASESQIRSFFEDNFTPHQVLQPDNSTTGLVTGYYVPDLRGSRHASPEYAHPLYSRPDDLLIVDLSDIYPDLAGYRLRGRLDGHRVVPYFDRSEIDGVDPPLAGNELFWVADPVELFFLQIQGSGRILLDDGKRVMVNYADQNGHPYRSIGKYLLDQGAMTRDQMSMQNIRKWAQNNRGQVAALLNQNPSYIFFRELEETVQSPPGALGVPLTPGRSLAVDPRHIPLGAPVFVETSWPNSDKPLQRLMVAQDTGGAIKGQVRGDFFWGMGAEAGALAGRMKQTAKFWVLLPKLIEETP